METNLHDFSSLSFLFSCRWETIRGYSHAGSPPLERYSCPFVGLLCLAGCTFGGAREFVAGSSEWCANDRDREFGVGNLWVLPKSDNRWWVCGCWNRYECLSIEHYFLVVYHIISSLHVLLPWKKEVQWVLGAWEREGEKRGNVGIYLWDDWGRRNKRRKWLEIFLFPYFPLF